MQCRDLLLQLTDCDAYDNIDLAALAAPAFEPAAAGRSFIRTTLIQFGARLTVRVTAHEDVLTT
jgi:hypothetical protein